MRPRAFTLIELLVVLAILGLLVGLMLPALGAARASAKATACGTQLKQIAAGQNAHAADHQGHFVHGAPSHPGITGPISAYDIWHAGSGPSIHRRWVGIGLLWRQGYLGSLRIGWCPLWDAPRYRYDDPTFGFAPDPGTAPGHGSTVSWSYHYRSAMDIDDGPPRPPDLGDDDAGDPFIADAFTKVPAAALGPGATPGPAKRFGHRNGYNVGYLDGAVMFLPDVNDVVSGEGVGAGNYEDQEGDVWEPYFERESEFFLGGPHAGTTAVEAPDEE